MTFIGTVMRPVGVAQGNGAGDKQGGWAINMILLGPCSFSFLEVTALRSVTHCEALLELIAHHHG